LFSVQDIPGFFIRNESNMMIRRGKHAEFRHFLAKGLLFFHPKFTRASIAAEVGIMAQEIILGDPNTSD